MLTESPPPDPTLAPSAEHVRAATLFAAGAAINAAFMVLASFGIAGVAYFIYEVSDQMPGINPMIPPIVGILGALNLGAAAMLGWVTMVGAGLRRAADPSRASRAFVVHMVVVVAESLVLMLGFTLVGCPVVPLVFIPGVVMAFMARKRLVSPDAIG